MTPAATFRRVLADKGLVEAMAAHSPLSAMLAAEAGFDAIWASGFELSALYGVPDTVCQRPSRGTTVKGSPSRLSRRVSACSGAPSAQGRHGDVSERNSGVC